MNGGGRGGGGEDCSRAVSLAAVCCFCFFCSSSAALSCNVYFQLRERTKPSQLSKLNCLLPSLPTVCSLPCNLPATFVLLLPLAAASFPWQSSNSSILAVVMSQSLLWLPCFLVIPYYHSPSLNMHMHPPNHPPTISHHSHGLFPPPLPPPPL